MDFALYTFLDGKWAEAKNLTQKNIALIIDTQAKTIYIWEGLFSSVQDQYKAQNLLTKVKLQYSNYAFRLMPKHPSEEITAFIGNALKDTEDVKNRLQMDSKQLESIQKGNTIGMIVILSALVIYILSKLMTPITSNTQLQEFYIFNDYDLSLFFVIAMVIILAVIILSTVNICCALIQKRYARVIAFTIVIIMSIVLIFSYWESQYLTFLIYQNLNQINTFSIPKYILEQFIETSTIILMVILVLVLIAFFIRREGFIFHLSKEDQPQVEENIIDQELSH